MKDFNIRTNTMNIVGEKLEHWALNCSDICKTDLFGRSAFNRFYYDVYLMTRTMLFDLKEDWGIKARSHRVVPGLLKERVKNEFENRSRSIRVLDSSELHNLKDSHRTSIKALADLLTVAYDLRVTADYDPNVPICQDNDVISLKSYKLSNARQWNGKVSLYCGSIRSAWRNAGLI